jgi:hypothetical protein
MPLIDYVARLVAHSVGSTLGSNLGIPKRKKLGYFTVRSAVIVRCRYISSCRKEMCKFLKLVN